MENHIMESEQNEVPYRSAKVNASIHCH